MTPKNILDDRVMYIAEPYSKGMRASINIASKYATGEYLMKVDAHCMFEEGLM